MSWFESWFNSPYYHILYQHRNEKDAELFLDKLLDTLKPPQGSSILDLGCGKGRHSVYLNEKGYTVTGIDLSPESIEYCSQFENDTLSFFVHDMRHLFRVNDFDYVFNLFTSFGYFDKDHESLAAIKNAAVSLKPGGTLVIDYLNTCFVKPHLIPEETVVVDSLEFRIKRKFEDRRFIKQIDFSDNGKDYSFTERVSGLELGDFERYFSACGMKIKKLYGDYNMNSYNANKSPRLIITAVKEHN